MRAFGAREGLGRLVHVYTLVKPAKTVSAALVLLTFDNIQQKVFSLPQIELRKQNGYWPSAQFLFIKRES